MTNAYVVDVSTVLKSLGSSIPPQEYLSFLKTVIDTYDWCTITNLFPVKGEKYFEYLNKHESSQLLFQIMRTYLQPIVGSSIQLELNGSVLYVFVLRDPNNVR